MNTNWRALCVELLDCLEKADWPNRYKVVFQQWTYIARKALAEPEPEGPTKDEAVALYSEVMAVHNCQTLGEVAEHFARAVLARWGTPNLTETRRSLTDARAASPSQTN